MKKISLTQLVNYQLTILLVLMSIGCSIGKSNKVDDNINLILIKNYYSKYKSDINKYQYFSLHSYELDSVNLKVYKISPEYNKIVLSPDGDGYFPKDYIQYKNKIFFIEGEITTQPSNKVFAFLKHRNLIDSTMYKVSRGMIDFKDVNDTDGKILSINSTKVASYVVCTLNNKILNQCRTNKSEVSAKNIQKGMKEVCN
ncbi:hypothetical protein [Flavobacterium sp. I3-2]|uniref:hypothetical protein n=1 Tax=Flavobacterium sp. I3-2 TaxID=2748319 RepID=UPI0015B2E3AD|nr:hypothetical protein [Flavobacterium sp. I3-2]